MPPLHPIRLTLSAVAVWAVLLASAALAVLLASAALASAQQPAGATVAVKNVAFAPGFPDANENQFCGCALLTDVMPGDRAFIASRTSA